MSTSRGHERKRHEIIKVVRVQHQGTMNVINVQKFVSIHEVDVSQSEKFDLQEVLHEQ